MTDTLVGRLIRIADASRREDGTDIPLGEQCREAAAEIERLTQERDELRAADRDHLSASRGMETRLRAEVDKERKRADDNFDAAVEADRGSAELKARALAAESSLSEVEKAAYADAAKQVPINWLDPLLTGDGVKRPPLGEREIEALLRGIQDRIRASAIRSRAAVLDSEKM